MVLIKPPNEELTLTYNLNQQLMISKMLEKESTISNRIVGQDEATVASFLAELPAVLASLESLSEKKDFRK